MVFELRKSHCFLFAKRQWAFGNFVILNAHWNYGLETPFAILSSTPPLLIEPVVDLALTEVLLAFCALHGGVGEIFAN